MRGIHLIPTLDLVSNIVTLDIQPAPPAWISEQIANAVKALDAPRVMTEADAKSRASAGRTLRFLNTPDAAVELARRLGVQKGVDSRDLIDTLYRAPVIAVLEKRLTASSESVDDRFLYTLAELSQLEASSGPMPPFPKEEAAKKAWQEESKRRSDLQQSKWIDYVKRLIGALPSKQPQARAECLDTLLNSSGLTGFQSAWLPGIVSSLRADFRLLPIRNQQNLLEYRWPAIKSLEMLPVLREIYAHPPEPRLDPPLQDSALRRIYELAPDEPDPQAR